MKLASFVKKTSIHHLSDFQDVYMYVHCEVRPPNQANKIAFYIMSAWNRSIWVKPTCPMATQLKKILVSWKEVGTVIGSQTFCITRKYIDY